MAQWNTPTQSFNNKDTEVAGRNDFIAFVQADHYGELAPWHPEFTSKNRLKTSVSETIIWSTFERYPDTDVWASALTGTGVAYINNDAAAPELFDPDAPAGNVILEKSVVMRVENPGDKVVRQTKRIVPYFPGKAQQLSLALNLGGHVANTRQRVGLFDENNGFYFECDGGQYSCVVRKNGVDTVRVETVNWNGDRLNGSGKSGITLDPTAQQLLAIEYEWYGTGAIRFGFVIDNEFHTIHTVNNANEVNGTWSKTPNLPVRLEMEALAGYGIYTASDISANAAANTITTAGSVDFSKVTGSTVTISGSANIDGTYTVVSSDATTITIDPGVLALPSDETAGASITVTENNKYATITQASTAITTEGQSEEGGVLNTAITGVNYGTNPPTVNMGFNNMPVAHTFYPILSIKLKDIALDSYVSPKNFQLWNHSDSHMTYVIVKNPTTLANATYAISDDDWVGAEVDQAADNVNFTADQVIFSGHIKSSDVPIEIPQDSLIQLGRKFANPGSPDFANLESDVLTICAAAMAANVTAYASITWTEQP